MVVLKNTGGWSSIALVVRGEVHDRVLALRQCAIERELDHEILVGCGDAHQVEPQPAAPPAGVELDVENAGVIAMLKGLFRDFYAKWAIGLVTTFIAAGRDPATFELPLGKQRATQNLACWLYEAFTILTGKRDRIVHCWDKTGLLGAWVRANGIEAVQRAAELFPNLAADTRGVNDAPPADPELDTDLGAPIDQPEDVAVLLPSGAVYHKGSNNSEASQLQSAAGWMPSVAQKKARPDRYGEGSEEWKP